MFEAQYLFSKDSDTGDAVFSPWFSRGGDQARFNLDLIQKDGAQIQVEVIHKSQETKGDGTAIAGTISFTASLGRSPLEITNGLLELVRYKITVKADTSGTLGYVLFRMLAPVWFDAVDTAT